MDRGNEVTGMMAKAAAAGEYHGDSESRRLLSRTSMVYLKRQAAEAKSRGTKDWIEERTKQRRSYVLTKTRVPQGTEEREKGSYVKVLPVADWAHPDRPLPQSQAEENRLGPMLVRDR